MAQISTDFADYCCELLASLGPCRAKRMFGGWGISCDGLTIAILADLGEGDTLWLKATDESRTLYEQAGCRRFSYTAKGMVRGLNYYSAPTEAMESPALMRDWARLAWQAAVQAHGKASAPKTPRKSARKPPR